MNKAKKFNKGVTLVVLVITIVILIILSTITINIALGDKGLLKKAEQARDLYANESTLELDALNEVDEYLKEKIDKVTSPDIPVDPVIEYTDVYVTLYDDGTLGFSNEESEIEGKTWNITGETFSAEWGLEEAPYYTVTTPWFADRESITKVVFSNEIVPKSVTALFMGCVNLNTIEGMKNLNTTNVSSLSAMFDDCASLKSIDLSDLKTSNVTDISYMFEGYNYDMSLTEIIGLDKLDTSKVTNMSGMFNNCSKLTKLDTNFDTSNVTDMSAMFQKCSSLTNITNINKFNTENVTNMEYMFYKCTSLTELNLSEFKTGNVEKMNNMFKDCSGLTSLNIDNFDTKKVTDMSDMFNNCSSLTNLNVGSFKTENVTDMHDMFKDCFNLRSLSVTNFDTRNVTDMSQMFWQCKTLENIDVSSFNTSKVTDMLGMFGGNDVKMALTEIKGLENFDTTEVTNMAGMFQLCANLTSLNLSSFNTRKVLEMSYMFNGCSGLNEIKVGPDWVISEGTDTTGMFTNSGVQENELTHVTI